jgi:hypothetical protein
MCVDERSRLWKHVRQVAVWRRQRFAEATDESACNRAGAGYGNLLAENRAHSKLEAIDASGESPAGMCPHDGTNETIVAEGFIDCDGVGIEVKKLPATTHCRAEVTDVT